MKRRLSVSLLHKSISMVVFCALVMGMAICPQKATATFITEYISDTFPSSISTSGALNFTVTVKNTGTSTWYQNESSFLRIPEHYDFQGVTAFVPYGYLTTNVSSGANYTFSISTTAPNSPGMYRYAAGLVVDQTGTGAYTWVQPTNPTTPLLVRDLLVNTVPSISVAVGNTATWVKSGDKLNISGTITDPDTQNFTVSYSLSSTTTPSTWTVCRSASSTKKLT